MPYDNPLLKELGGYFTSEEPGRRERADAWATAIGLQQVDGLTPSRFLFDTAKEHIEGRITQNQARRRIRDYYTAQNEMKSRYLLIGLTEDDKRKIRVLSGMDKGREVKEWETTGKVVRKSGQKNADRLLGLLKDRPQATQGDMVAIVGINRSAIQRHLSNLKAAGRLLRIGPDKGGHWEVVD